MNIKFYLFILKHSHLLKNFSGWKKKKMQPRYQVLSSTSAGTDRDLWGAYSSLRPWKLGLFSGPVSLSSDRKDNVGWAVVIQICKTLPKEKFKLKSDEKIGRPAENWDQIRGGGIEKRNHKTLYPV